MRACREWSARRVRVPALCLTLCLALCLGAFSSPYAAAAAEDESPPARYRVQVEAPLPRALRSELLRASQAAQLRGVLPANYPQLLHRVQLDRSRLGQVLRARGYYAAKIDPQIDTNARPWRVRFAIDPGPRYVVGVAEVKIDASDWPLGDLSLPLLKPGMPAEAEAVLAAGPALIDALGERGYPFATHVPPALRVDHDRRAMDITYTAAPGPLVHLGEVRPEGLERVQERFLHRRRTWEPGDRYQASAMRLYRDRLIRSGLFSVIDAQPDRTPGEEGLHDVGLRLLERPHRSLQAGVNYRSDEGFGTRLQWENRNLFGGGERLAFGATLAEIQREVSGVIEEPDFLAPNLKLSLEARYGEEETDAFDSRYLKTGAIFRRDIGRRTTATAGVVYRDAAVTQQSITRDYRYIGLPLGVDWNRNDDLLNPSRGQRLLAEFTPYQDLGAQPLQFTRTFLEGRQYFPLLNAPRLVAAFRLSGGLLHGADRDDIPPDERFYAGGGGSIRGYGYQSVGPHSDGKPVGGKSMLETSAELRWLRPRGWAFAAFVDGGNVFEDTVPNPFRQLKWGAGLGLRYYGAFGPLRLDVAVPLEEAGNVFSELQFYISLGQAF